MEESWEDLLCRVYRAGYEDCQHERGFDPKSVKVVHTARIRAALLEQRIRELESTNAALLSVVDRFVEICDNSPPIEILNLIGELVEPARAARAKARGERDG